MRSRERRVAHAGGPPSGSARLQRELKARRGAGLDSPFLNARLVSAGKSRWHRSAASSKDGATLDPYRACLGLAAAARARGAQSLEALTGEGITFGRKAVDVRTAGGTIRAEQVVIATGTPTDLFASLQRHFWFRTTYLALTGRAPPRSASSSANAPPSVRDSAEPPHVVRWVDDDRLLVMGADRETPPDRLRDKTTVQRTGQLMYELSTMYPDISGILPSNGWDAPYARTADGLPYFGPHRNFPRHLFAFGDSSHSVTGSYLASRVLLRHYLGELDPADELFAFSRNVR